MKHCMGQSLTEYGMIAVLIAVASLGALSLMSSTLVQSVSHVSRQMMPTQAIAIPAAALTAPIEELAEEPLSDPVKFCLEGKCNSSYFIEPQPVVNAISVAGMADKNKGTTMDASAGGAQTPEDSQEGQLAKFGSNPTEINGRIDFSVVKTGSSEAKPITDTTSR